MFYPEALNTAELKWRIPIGRPRPRGITLADRVDERERFKPMITFGAVTSYRSGAHPGLHSS